jgi:hypothetical protein
MRKIRAEWEGKPLGWLKILFIVFAANFLALAAEDFFAPGLEIPSSEKEVGKFYLDHRGSSVEVTERYYRFHKTHETFAMIMFTAVAVCGLIARFIGEGPNNHPPPTS